MIMRRSAWFWSSSLFAVGALCALGGVASATEGAPSAALSASSAPPAVGAGAVAPSADPAVVASLVALSACDGKRLTEDCAPADAWRERVRAVEALGQDCPTVGLANKGETLPACPGKDEKARYAIACVEQVKHASASVREAAAECVRDFADHVPDRKSAAVALLEQFAVDTSADAREGQLAALRWLEPTEHGVAPAVVAHARRLVGLGSAKRELAALVHTLEARYSDAGPAPESVSFAIELLKRREAVEDAVGVLARAKDPSEAVCAALLDVAATKRGHWADAVRAIGADEGRCKAQRDRAVEIVLEVAKRPAGPSKKFGLGESSIALAGFVADGAPTAEQKAKLREALALAEAVEGRAALERLREELGSK